jgi:hypothetical protein
MRTDDDAVEAGTGEELVWRPIDNEAYIDEVPGAGAVGIHDR